MVVFKYVHDSFLTVNINILEKKREKKIHTQREETKTFHLALHLCRSKFLPPVEYRENEMPVFMKNSPRLS